jgi:hypoxanthine phosphoribosyltransferase
MHPTLTDLGYKTWITWHDVLELCDKLVDSINESNFKPKHIVGLSRGGLIPATIIANQLSVREVYVHGYHSYDDQTNMRDPDNPHGVMYQDVVPDLMRNCQGREVLIVDDLCDEGITMLGLLRRLEKKFADGAVKVKCAALYCKQHSKFQPIYTGESVGNDWLVFPWETS